MKQTEKENMHYCGRDIVVDSKAACMGYDPGHMVIAPTNRISTKGLRFVEWKDWGTIRSNWVMNNQLSERDKGDTV